MKRIVSIALALCAVLTLTACSKDPSGSSSFPFSSRSSSTSTEKEVITAAEGIAEGRIGDTLRNVFFEYTVLSAKLADQYGDYLPAEGKTLLDAEITVKNVFGEEIEMYNSDFQVQWGDGDQDFGYGVLLPDDETIMPEAYPLKRGESVTYHVLYEVPEGSTDFSISYLEVYEDDSEGDVFFVYFEL